MLAFLTDGSAVSFDIDDDLTELNQNVLQGASRRLSQIESADAEPALQAKLLHEICICELHFLAGQLIDIDGSHHLGLLLASFESFWSHSHSHSQQ